MMENDMMEADVDAFAGKLDVFRDGLSSKERLFLATIIRRAAHAGRDEVQGYMQTDPWLASGDEVVDPKPDSYTLLLNKIARGKQ